MSQVKLGGRYSSQDMYRDYPNLKPGDKIAIEKDGVIYTDIVSSVTYSSGEPEIWAEPSWWQNLARHRRLRWIVPARWRQPMKPTRAGKPASVQIDTLGDRRQRLEDKTNEIIRGLLEEKP